MVREGEWRRKDGGKVGGRKVGGGKVGGGKVGGGREEGGRMEVGRRVGGWEEGREKGCVHVEKVSGRKAHLQLVLAHESHVGMDSSLLHSPM